MCLEMFWVFLTFLNRFRLCQILRQLNIVIKCEISCGFIFSQGFSDGNKMENIIKFSHVDVQLQIYLKEKIKHRKASTKFISFGLHCKENSIYVFLFWELRGLSPNFHIHVSVCDLYIPRIGPHISCRRICRPILEIYKSLTDIWV